jgi:hypothetical protein
MNVELRWIEGEQIFAFWIGETREHLHDPARLRLEDYPDCYFYYASEWILSTGK